MRKRIASPAEGPLRWWAGIEATVQNPVSRHLLLFGLYTGMRRGEIMPLRWDRVDLAAGFVGWSRRRPGVPLELPVTRQLGASLARPRADGEAVRGMSEVLASRVVERLHHGGGTGPDAAAAADHATGQPRAAPGRYRGLRRRLDGGVSSRAAAPERRPHRRVDGAVRVRGGGSPARKVTRGRV